MKPIPPASSSVTSRPTQPASFLPANTGVPPGSISSSRRLEALLWRSKYHPVAWSIAQLAPYPIAAPMPSPTLPLFVITCSSLYGFSVARLAVRCSGYSRVVPPFSGLDGGFSPFVFSACNSGCGGERRHRAKERLLLCTLGKVII